MKFSIGKGNSDLRTRLEEKKKAKRKKPGVTKRAKRGRTGLGVFLAIFLFIGLAFGYIFIGRPVINLINAQDWPGVPAVVTSSELQENSGSDGSTYKIQISFAYEFNGQRRTSDTYDFFTFMSSSGYDGKKQIVNQYPAGKQTTCFVNPNDPSVAVLSRGWSNNIWFGAIPLVFVLIGGGGLVGMFLSGKRERWATKSAKGTDRVGPRSEDEWLPKFARSSEQDGGIDSRARSDADTVSPTRSRLSKLAFVLVFMLIWDGVTFAVLASMFKDGIADNWGPALFMIPFVLIGIGFLFAAGYMVLSLSNPVVRMRFDPRVIPWGAPLRVDWTIDGRAERIERLTVTVEGLERASYTRGTDTITDEHLFFEHTLYDAEAMDRRDPMSREGNAELQLPANAMHSLDANHNKVVWRIKVKGEIPKWPDVNDEYEFAVVPAPLGPNPRGMF